MCCQLWLRQSPHLTTHDAEKPLVKAFLSEAEGEGFEPSSDPEARNGFRDGVAAKSKLATCRGLSCWVRAGAIVVRSF